MGGGSGECSLGKPALNRELTATHLRQQKAGRDKRKKSIEERRLVVKCEKFDPRATSQGSSHGLPDRRPPICSLRYTPPLAPSGSIIWWLASQAKRPLPLHGGAFLASIALHIKAVANQKPVGCKIGGRWYRAVARYTVDGGRAMTEVAELQVALSQ